MFVGLGNPGLEYLHTRHNAGFMAVDYINSEVGEGFEGRECSSIIAKGKSKGRKLLMAKPQTFMNLSGKAVTSLVNRFAVDLEEVTIIHDDVDIPLGEIKEKKKGGSAGHNGIASIMEEMGTGNFRRIRIGVGRPEKGGDTAEYVLSEFEENEKELLAKSIEDCYRLAFNY